MMSVLLPRARCRWSRHITLGSLAGQSGRYRPDPRLGLDRLMVVVLGGRRVARSPADRTLPWVLVLFMLATLVSALVLPRGRVHADERPPSLRMAPVIVACSALVSATRWRMARCYAFLSLHLEREGYSEAMIGLLWTLGVAAEVLVFLYLPQLFRRFALSTLLVASLGCGGGALPRHRLDGARLWIVLLAQSAARRHFRLVPRRGCRRACMRRCSPGTRKPAGRRCFPAWATAPARRQGCCSRDGAGRAAARP